MISRRSFVGLAAATAATGTVASCSGGASGGSDGSGTLKVWHMNGDYTAETIEAINEKFTAKTGAKVDAQVQEWDGITTKVTSALATSDPPDVIDMGNTQVATYAANGALMDITPHQEDLQQGNTWLDGLVDPATIDGKLYGVPGFAGCRAVIYNKKMWKDAGITEDPTTFEELLEGLEKIAEQNDDSTFSALYLPGQMWYAGLQFVWDAGGEIATESGDTWEAEFSTPEGIQGLEDWKKFQNAVSSPASQTLDTDKPPIETVFANGDAAAIIQTPVYIEKIKKANPDLTDDDLGTFPMPSQYEDGSQPVMLGGSDWGVAARSKNQELALEYLKIAASTEIQTEWVAGNDNWLPTSVEGLEKAKEQAPRLKQAYLTAAKNSKATPANPNWTELEATKEINHLFSNVASGDKTPEQSAEDFDAEADQVLNSDS